MDTKTTANEIRGEILRVETMVKNLKANTLLVDLPDHIDRGEMIANEILAYRHLEDARMRMGKVIQAYEGGVSIYDKSPPPHAAAAQ